MLSVYIYIWSCLLFKGQFVEGVCVLVLRGQGWKHVVLAKKESVRQMMFNATSAEKEDTCQEIAT